MTAPTIEQRLEALEREVRLLRAAVMGRGEKEKPWWERFAGIFSVEYLRTTLCLMK